MALHIAEQIMQSVETTLTGLTTTGNRIKRARAFSVDESINSAITLSMGSDTLIDQDNQQFTKFDSILEVDVDVLVRACDEQVDTKLNLIRSEITIALLIDHTQNGLVIDTEEIGSEEPEISGEGENVIGIQRSKYLFRYRRMWNDPTK